MKTILWMFLFGAMSAGHAQAKPPSCDDLKGLEKEACLKKGGTVQTHNAASGASAKRDPEWPKEPKRTSGERYADPAAPTDYTKPDDKKREAR